MNITKHIRVCSQMSVWLENMEKGPWSAGRQAEEPGPHWVTETPRPGAHAASMSQAHFSCSVSFRWQKDGRARRHCSGFDLHTIINDAGGT